jgi:hypothetical protein
MSISEQLKEVEDELDLKAPISRIIQLNSPEWGFIVVGCLAAMINGGENPAFAVMFTYILSVCRNSLDNVMPTSLFRIPLEVFLEPLDQQEQLVNKYCLLFLTVGVVLAIGQFMMVSTIDISLRMT